MIDIVLFGQRVSFFSKNSRIIKRNTKSSGGILWDKLMEQLRQTFVEVYGTEPEASFFLLRGAWNLIGEHTDYNGGHVFSLRDYAGGLTRG